MCLPRSAVLALLVLCNVPGCDPPAPRNTSTTDPAQEGPRQAPPNSAGDPAQTVKEGQTAERTGREDRARRAFERACNLGDAYACIRLAELLESSDHAADFDRARALYEQACAAGASEGCDALGH